MKLFLAAVALVAVFAGPDEREAVRDFEKAFRVGRTGPNPVHERVDAIALLEGFDSKSVAEALVDAFGKVEREVQVYDEKRAELSAEIAEILERVPNRKFTDQKLFAKYRGLSAESSRLRKLLDGMRTLQFELRARLLRLQEAESLGYLVKEVLADKKQPLFLKLTVSTMAERFDDALMGELEKSLRRGKRSSEIVPLLDALGEAQKIGKKLADRILKLLDHKEEAVRERAALALAKLEWRTAVLPIIDRLDKEQGLTKKRMAEALANLTGMTTLGTMVSSWRAWWEKEGQAFLRDGRKEQEVRVGLGHGSKGGPDPAGGTGYFGIPQDGKALIYVIDSSGSMRAEIDMKKKGSVAQGESSKMTRLDGCKKELIGAIGRLLNGKKFNVVHYSDLPHKWQPKLVEANEKTKKEAIAWVEKLTPNGSTNIHDALQTSFGFVGRGGRDKYYETEVDTIFLLSDGTPTTPDGKIDDVDKILKAVRTWNAMQRVKIHSIAIGKNLNARFMQQLAAENGGEFRRAMK